MKQEDDVIAKSANEENGSEADSIEELAEPKFKYKRLLNDFTKIWTNDAVNCFIVHPKLLAVGTQWGKIYLMDHTGTIIQDKVINAHTVAVNQISIDEPGEYLGSCSNDGKILIYGLWSSEFNQVVSMDRPIRSIALEPEFSRPSAHQQFVTGDRVLVFHERTFFQRDKQAIIYAGKERDGFIHEISWKGPYIAFANDSGVRVYDRDYKTLITHVVREHDLSLRSELFPCHIFWMDSMNFVIGWANFVTICDVKDTTARSTFQSPESGGRFVEIRHSWEIGQRFVCGLSCTYPNKFLVVLTVCKRASDSESGTPENFKRAPNSESGIAERVSDESGKGIAGKGDKAESEGIDEGTKQHVEKPEYPRVLLLEPISFQVNLISIGDFSEAAKLCPSICGNRKDIWEEYVNRFEQVRQSRLIAPYLPTQSPQLEPECYEMVLLEFLRSDVPGFKKLARQWSRDLYRVGAIIKETLERLYRQTSEETLSAADRADLLETLAQLYTYERNYERALAIYMKVGNRSVFPLIEQFNLFPMVKDKIHELMCIDKDLAVRLLLNNEDSLPAATVVKQLSRQPELQLAYLDRLFARGEGADFADLAISLYAEKGRKRLLPFLRNNEHYKLDKALQICRQRNLIPEVVFLLGRSGNRREALKVIIRDSGDINEAIDFCKEHDDSDLWQDLIDYSLMNPKFVTILMENIGTHVDPTLLIRKIPDRMKIPGLRESLVKILQDFQMQISLREGCQRVLVSDCHALMNQTVKFRQQGSRVGLDDSCSVCGKCLVQTDPRYAQDIQLFWCHHAVHEACTKNGQCPICSEAAKFKVK